MNPGLWSIAPGRSVGLSTSQPSAQRSASPPVYPKQHKTDTGRLRVYACVCVCLCVCQGMTSNQRIWMTPFQKVNSHSYSHPDLVLFALLTHKHTHTRSNTYSQFCLYNSMPVLPGVCQEGAVNTVLPLFEACLIFWTHKVMQSCPMKYVQALSQTLTRSLSF